MKTCESFLVFAESIFFLNNITKSKHRALHIMFFYSCCTLTFVRWPDYSRRDWLLSIKCRGHAKEERRILYLTDGQTKQKLRRADKHSILWASGKANSDLIAQVVEAAVEIVMRSGRPVAVVREADVWVGGTLVAVVMLGVAGEEDVTWVATASFCNAIFFFCAAATALARGIFQNTADRLLNSSSTT